MGFPHYAEAFFIFRRKHARIFTFIWFDNSVLWFVDCIWGCNREYHCFFVLKHEKLDFNDWMILEAYCILGGFLGAKLLYLLVSYKSIDWSRITDFQYFNALMLSGFVFYGGLIFGLIFVFLAGKIHKIPAGIYVRKFIFLIPFMHSFGRVGCFMAGCCYGIPYDGIGAVVFPEGSYAIPGIKLFPVQFV